MKRARLTRRSTAPVAIRLLSTRETVVTGGEGGRQGRGWWCKTKRRQIAQRCFLLPSNAELWQELLSLASTGASSTGSFTCSVSMAEALHWLLFTAMHPRTLPYRDSLEVTPELHPPEFVQWLEHFSADKNFSTLRAPTKYAQCTHIASVKHLSFLATNT